MNNIYIINKPKGWTSFDVVAKVRQLTGIKKVGHAGTLDPLATGVLIVAVGREATRQISQIMHQQKEYLAKIKLGETSSTDDEEGLKENPKAQGPRPKINKEIIKEIIKKFIGEISQVPPAYSAIKIAGQRAYKLARKGKPIKLKARPVVINDIKIISYRWPYLKIKVVCGSGTYIRSLARDIGKELGVGGYLADLERTRVGGYGIEEAIKVNDLKEKL